MKRLLTYLDDKIPEEIKFLISSIALLTIVVYVMSCVSTLEVNRKLSDTNNTPEFNVLCKRVLSDGFVSMNELTVVRHRYLDQ